MKLACALLTAVLLRLFIHYCAYGYRSRAAKKAGRLLLRLRMRRRWLPMILLIAFLCLSAVACISVTMLSSRDSLPFSSVMAFIDLSVGLGLADMLLVYFKDIELHEHGILDFSRGPLAFSPWHYVRYCRWRSASKQLLVQYLQHRVDYPICPEQADEANAILAKYVKVRDADGRSIESSERRQPLAERMADLPGPEMRRWQFSLRTLLLLMLVLSSAFSWLGVCMRGWEQQRRVIAQFEEMQASVTYQNNDVVSLDFSKCKVKPTDRDLVHLAKLPRLQTLILDGAPITDAGLKHLEGAPSLRWVSLWQTHVTDEGVQELQGALPDTSIGQ